MFTAKKSVVPRVIVKLPGLKNRLGIERCTEQQTESKQRCLANNLTFDSCLKAKTYRGGPRGVAVDNLSAALVNAILAVETIANGRAIAGKEWLCLKIKLSLPGSQSSNFFSQRPA